MIEALCLEEDCKENRKSCSSCFLKFHEMHKRIFLDDNEKLFKKFTINSKSENKEAYKS